MTVIYFDNNASTALDDRVLDAMLPALRHTGNASSWHELGRWARATVEQARAQVATFVGASPAEVTFTSGATEANNLAIKGVALAAGRRRRVVCAATEHPSVLQPVLALGRAGFDVQVIPVDRHGVICLDELQAAITDDTCLVTVMAANNETGVLAPLPVIAAMAHARGSLLHTDATQLGPWGRVDLHELGADLLSLSSHKMHGPQGAGALIAARGTPLEPLLHGGGHERGVRSGTLNTAGVVGFGTACRLAADLGPGAAGEAGRLRDLLERLLTAAAPTVVNGVGAPRLPGTLNIAFPGTEADAVMVGAPSVAMATGSACSTGVPGPSHVLTAMGLGPDLAGASLRFGVSRQTTSTEVEAAAAAVVVSVDRVRDRDREVVPR